MRTPIPPDLRRHVAAPPSLLVLVACAAAAVTLGVARARGVQTYVTDPFSVVSLSGSAIAIAALGSTLGARARPTRGWLVMVGTAVAGYLVLGAGATVVHAAQDSAPSAAASLVIGLWAVWWVVPLITIQVAALRGGPPGWPIALVALSAVFVIAMTLLGQPTEPFGPLPTAAAPDDVPATPLLDAFAAVVGLAVLVAPALLGVRAARATAEQRTPAVLAGAAAAICPLLIVVCVGLAVARDPGDVDPALGSVAYFIVYSFGCLLAAVALYAAEQASTSTPVARRILIAVTGAYATVAVLLVGTWVSGLLADAGTLSTVVVVGLLVFGVTLMWTRVLSELVTFADVADAASSRDRGASGDPPPATVHRDRLPPLSEREAALRDRVTQLSPREGEVLALVAGGARDGEIAAQLHLSKRTVETHMRRVFQKLELDAEDGKNRRLLAARAWLDARNADVTG